MHRSFAGTEVGLQGETVWPRCKAALVGQEGSQDVLGRVRVPAEHAHEYPQVRPPTLLGKALVDLQHARSPLNAFHQRAQRLHQPSLLQSFPTLVRGCHVHKGALQAVLGKTTSFRLLVMPTTIHVQSGPLGNKLSMRLCAWLVKQVSLLR